MSLCTFDCSALDVGSLPFMGKKDEFEIKLSGNSNLKDALKAEVIQQRAGNGRLKQYQTLSKIARYESELLTQKLKAEGYYKPKVKFTTDKKKIIYNIDPGGVYRIKGIELTLPKNTIAPPASVLKLKSGDILIAAAILSAQKSLENYIKDNFCLYDISVEYRVILDHKRQSAEVSFVVQDSPSVRFGKITFSGLQTVEDSYLIDRLTFKEGECFKRYQVDATRLKLIQTNLLVSAKAEISEPNHGEVPIHIHAIERKHRTVSIGLGFDSEKGFGIAPRWRHRNLFGRAEQLNVALELTEHATSISTSLTLPNFRSNNQTITFYTEWATEKTDAFDSEVGSLGAEVSRQLKRNLRAIAGPALAFSNIVENEQEDNFALVSFLMGLEYDKRDDLLNPQKGWLISGSATPFWDASETSTNFLKTSVSASFYHTFSKVSWRPTIALRSTYGTITGIAKKDVPANERFYVGGGGSVRGYAYQSLGPISDGQPDGGLSYNEVTIETRLRWGQNWGGAVFIDGGFAYESEKPKWFETHYWGAGIGIRYFTSFAPIRFDVGVPLNKRDGIDDDFQVYISIGQAF